MECKEGNIIIRQPRVASLIDYKLECKALPVPNPAYTATGLIDYKLECKGDTSALFLLSFLSLIDYKLECKAIIILSTHSLLLV